MLQDPEQTNPETPSEVSPPREEGLGEVIPPPSIPSPGDGEGKGEVESITPVPSPSALSTLADKFLDNMRNWRDGLALANAKRREQPLERLEKILKHMEPAAGLEPSRESTITSLQVQKMFKCSTISAWRYLRALEKSGKLRKLRRIGPHGPATYELVK